MSCGERIQKLRKGKKLSVEQVSREVGVSADLLRTWEQGGSLPDAGKMLVLAAVLGTTADYLQTGNKAQEKNPSETWRKLGSVLFVAALILYFAGMRTGAFNQQMILFGIPLLNYGTSPLAVCLLISAALGLAAGILSKIYSAKIKNQER